MIALDFCTCVHDGTKSMSFIRHVREKFSFANCTAVMTNVRENLKTKDRFSSRNRQWCNPGTFKVHCTECRQKSSQRIDRGSSQKLVYYNSKSILDINLFPCDLCHWSEWLCANIYVMNHSGQWHQQKTKYCT